MNSWTLPELEQAMIDDLQKCNTELERSCCKAICVKEMRETYHGIIQSRAPTGGETAVAKRHIL